MNAAMEYLKSHGLIIVFFWVLVEQAGVPIPAAPLLLIAGSLCATGFFHLSPVLMTAVLACLLSDSLWFYLGRRKGSRVLAFMCRISMEPDSCVRRTHNLFTKYGLRGIVLAKFVPGLSTLAPPLAGMSGTVYGAFLLADFTGSTLYTGAFILMGYCFSNQIQQITDALDSIGRGAMFLLASLILIYLVVKQWQRQRIIKELRMTRITVKELRKKQTDGEHLVIIDLRPEAELRFNPATIPGSIHLKLDEIDTRLHEVPRDQEIVVYCSCPNEVSSARMALFLQRKGLKRVRPLLGGIEAWRELDYPVQPLVFD